MKELIKQIDKLYDTVSELEELERTPEIEEEITRIKRNIKNMEEKATALNSPWDKVELARMIERPKSSYYIESIVEDFVELHGDRAYADDQAIIGGIGKIGSHVVTIIGQNKGTNSKENVKRNFGMPHPEGYRKALRLMKQAEKFKRPIVCLIDTPGAYCGLGAEERGQGEAIARNLMEMAMLKVPIVSGVIGEGGSGGALALGVADKVFMQENTTYSILSPEGFASILWKDSTKAKQAAGMMKITADNLYTYKIIDDIVKEPVGGAHRKPEEAAKYLKAYIISALEELKQQPVDQLLEERYQRFRKYGEFYE